MDTTKKDTADKLVATLLGAYSMEPWGWTFRSSALPLCQLQVIWFEMDQGLGELPGRKQSYFSDFFLNTGTVAHTVTQRWLGRLGLLFGRWKCPKCGKVSEPVLGIQTCCKVESVYEEFEFNDLPTGHCDGLLKLWDLTPEINDFILLEIKTTMRSKLPEIRAGNFAFNYRIQATVYAHKLRAMGYNVRDVLFLFIPRDYPRDMTPVWFKPARAKMVHENAIQEYEAVLGALKSRDFSNITGICGCIDDARDCPYRVSCFSPVAHELWLDKFIRFYDTDAPPKSLPQFPT